MRATKVPRLLMVFPVLVLTAWLAPAVSLAGEAVGHVNFLFGQKALDREDWVPVEKQIDVGVEGTWGWNNWPFSIATDLYFSRDSGTLSGVEFEGETREAGIGIRRVWNNEYSYLYLGFGVDYLSARAEVAGVREDDSTLGGWAGGGLFWRLGPRANIGVALRYSNGRVTLFDAETKAGGIQSGLLLGWGWGASR